MEQQYRNAAEQPLPGSLDHSLVAQVVERLSQILTDILPKGIDLAFDIPLRSYGLSSIMATRLWFEIHREFAIDIPMEWLGTSASLSQLAARIVEQRQPSPSQQTAIPEIRANPADRFQPFPLTPIQEAYLIGKQPDLTADAVGCHLYREFEVANLDVDRLRAAWQRLIMHHDILRACITPDGQQRIQEHAPEWQLAVHEVSGTAEEFAAQVAAVRSRLSHRLYDLEAWPLWSIEVTRSSSGKGIVHFSIDAMLTDGHGLGLLLNHWWRCYQQPDEPLPQPEFSARDCVLALDAYQTTPAYSEDLDYWVDKLVGMPPGPGITLAPETTGDGSTNLPRRALSGWLTKEQWQAVRQRADALNVSPTALVLALFSEALGRHGAQRPFSLVLTTNSRLRLPPQVEQIVGPFTSTMVFVVEDTFDRPFDEAVQEIQQRLWEDLGHASVSGVAAMRELRTRNKLLQQPALPVVFTSMLDVSPGSVAVEGFGSSVTYATSQTSGIALDHQMWEQNGELHFRWDVTDALFPVGAIETLFATFTNSLYACCVEQEVQPTIRPLNELQKAYYVPRAAGSPTGWDGCQVYHSFQIQNFDRDRLETAWLKLIEAYEVLRTVVTHDGQLLILSRGPERWQIPVIDLAGVEDAQAILAAMRDEMVGRAFPLDRWPQCELRVTLSDSGTATLHYLIDLTLADGRSIHFLFRELLRLYADQTATPRLPAPYAEYVQEQANLRASADQRSWLDYWQNRFKDLPPGPQIPAREYSAEDRRRVRLEGRIQGWQRCKERAQSHQIAPDMILLAALMEALATRFAGAFTLPVVCWTQPEERFRPGEFTALSWATRAPGNLSLIEQARLYQQQIERDLPSPVSGLGELRKLVMKERRKGAFAFPVVYTSILDLTSFALPPGVSLGPWMTYTPDVSLDCISIEEGDELRYYWDAVAADFPGSILNDLFAVYQCTLERLAADESFWSASATSDRLALAGEAAAQAPTDDPDLQTILYTWNDTAVEFPDQRLAHLLFEDWAKKRPDATALRYSGGTISYADLNRQANLIAWRLKQMGVGPEKVVAISIRRSPAMIAAVLGVLKAGGVYLPVEPYLPQERAAVMIEDARAAILLSTSDTSRWEAPAGVRVLDIDDELELFEDSWAWCNPEPSAGPDNTAYIIFTSGSTGKPKGVAVAHRPVLNLLNWCAKTFNFNEADVGLCVTSLGFDLSVFDILGLLSYGASLYIADEMQQKDPAMLLDLLLNEPITFWNSAPTTLNQLVPLLPQSPAQQACLRLVFLSGDYTPLPLPDSIRGVFPHAQIVSLGGATEATVWSNYFPVGAIDPQWRSIPYGRPIDNARYHILDAQLEPCRVGVEGDLYITGDCLSLGYYNQPALTAERFIPNPFALTPGERMYKTGDRAAYFSDGNICFLGRADNQVKIRGFRVELGEIEYQLRQHPAVKDVVVLVRKDHLGDQKLVAYVIPATETPPPVKELRAHVAQALPDYMVPNFVAFLKTFPATSNGKLDREALPWPVEKSAPEPAPSESSQVVEQLTAEIGSLFKELLGLAHLDPDQDLWDQGATSFTMVRVSSALQKRYRQRIAVSALLAQPTVAGIARFVAANLPESGEIERQVGGAATVRESSEQRAAAKPAPVAMERQMGGTTTVRESLEQRAAAARPVLPAAPASNAASTDAPALPEQIDFFSAEERARFKEAQWNIRQRGPEERLIGLQEIEFAREQYAWRSSYREFLDQPVQYTSFCRFLSLLSQAAIDGQTRRLYPSAGDTYAVQIYIHVRAGGVEGIAEGVYYYNPSEHALHAINEQPQIDRSIHFYYNRPIFDKAAFSIYLVGQMRAIEPLYREDSERFLLLEAGYIGQLLMMGQAACQIGLCPIGTLAFDKIRAELRLDEGHRFLHGLLGGAVAHPLEAASTGERPVFSAPDQAKKKVGDVAIVGMAGRYPDADNLADFWRNLRSGKRSIEPLPARRLPAGKDSAIPVAGGFLERIDQFDSLLFHISPREARMLDPQMRLLLETVWECLEHAGYTAVSLQRAAGRVGVFVGVMWHDYEQVGSDSWEQTGVAQVSAIASDIPNRISHFFHFQGPSLAVNTSCSSSLAALHLAVESLRRGECDAAIVGAVNLVAHPYHIELLSGLNLIARDGTPGAFDGDTPGWSPGEGVGVMLLRPADAAAQDNDTIHGIIEGTWIGHSGHTSRFGAPDASALADSIVQALDQCKLIPGDINYIECAATGATLADAAEIEALGRVFDGASNGKPLPVGTLKPNIGHLEAASGISQLTKVLLQMQHRQIAPTLVSPRANPLVSWDDSPIGIAGQLQPWEPGLDGRPLRALINALGATGSYGHAVVRAPVPVSPRFSPSAEQVIILSAASQAQLMESARRLSEYLKDDGAGLPLADIAFTLQTGRVPMACRLAVVCSDLADLAARLEAFSAGAAASGVHTSVVERSPSSTAICPPDQSEAMRLWLDGYTILWEQYWNGSARRVPLPTYPFAQESFWLNEESSAARTAEHQPESADREALRTRIEDYLKQIYAEVSGIPVSSLSVHTPLEHYGLNSYLIACLNTYLERDFGETSRTLFFEYPDLSGVAGYLMERQSSQWQASNAENRLQPGATASAPIEPSPAAAEQDDIDPEADDGIAIIGLAGRYPQARNLEQFWQNLQAGRDCVTPLPDERRREGWPADLMWGGFLDDVDRFDPLFFNITPKDAELMDPQERLFLEVVWEALEDAGYTPDRLRRQHQARVAVYAGSMYNEYPFFGVEQSLDGSPVYSGSALAGIANRVSYFLDLHGPSMTVDTMCSSSLTSIHLAVESLKRGECEVAIAGGVNLSLHPNKFIQQLGLHMTSSNHRCRSFGAGGDGFIPGEGVGAVILKPLRRAIADGDRIQAVILATAVNHGGKTNGYMVPNPVAQGMLIAEALRKAGASPATITYLEAHGTGTELGDPVEINGLLRAFADENLPPASCAIGSVKSNIGHLEAAAGIAGLTKVVLQMQHGYLVPSLHAEELNPNIDWKNAPFYVQRELAPWNTRTAMDGSDKPIPRRAGISSFGAGGANAHVIVEEYVPVDAPAKPAASRNRPQLVVLSARDDDQLKAVAANLAGFLQQYHQPRERSAQQLDVDGLIRELARLVSGELPANLAADGETQSLRDILARLMQTYGAAQSGEQESWSGPDLEDIAFTLQIGREAFRERLALVVSDPVDLCTKLEAYCNDDATGVLRGRAPRREHAPQQVMPASGSTFDEQVLLELGKHWIAGGTVDWTRLHQGQRSNLVKLPSYPFARVRCWLPEPERQPAPRTPEIPLYEKTWAVANTNRSKFPTIKGRILCLVGERSEALARELEISLGSNQILFLRKGSGALAYHDEASAVRLVESLLNQHSDIAGWIDLYDLYQEQDDSASWLARIAMLQHLLKHHRSGALRILHLTYGLQPLDGPRPSLAGARMAGLVRMLGAEYQRVIATTLDTDQPQARARLVADEILAEWDTPGFASEVCYRRDQRYEPQLCEVAQSSHADLRLGPNSAYLVTGGTRGIGALVARHLVRRGARKLVLMGARSLPGRERWHDPNLPDAAKAAIANILELERRGAQVMLYTGSLSHSDELARFLAEVRASLGNIAGVIHCAGTGSQGSPSFVHKSLDEMRAVFEPKIDGLEVLADLCSDDPLSFFILFSSVSAAIPKLAAGVADYATANAFMDFFASYQARIGKRWFRSINWPVWAESDSGRGSAAALARVGLASLTDEEGLRLLEQIIALSVQTNVLPCPPIAGVFDPQSLLESKSAATVEARHDREPAGELPSAAQPTSKTRPLPWLVKLFSESLHIPEKDLDPTALFGELGVESVMLAELLQKIEAHLDRHLEPSTLLDYPTLEELSAHLAQIDPRAAESAAQDSAPVEERSDSSIDQRSLAIASQVSAPVAERSRSSLEGKVAVIGMACRFPGAPDIAAFWSNLVAGRCSVTEVPPSRWDAGQLYQPQYAKGKSVSKWGGFVEGIEEFDADYFGMTEEEATCLDPAIRLFLECSVTCLRDAGYNDKELWGRDVGVFVGSRMSNYRRRVGIRGGAAGLGADQNFIAARVAHQFNFFGPNLVVDSACSSSLVAVQLACRSVLDGESELALVGGVDILLDEEPYLEFSAARALSPSGKCYTFDERANGFVPGEGCGVILIKPLAQALKDGDRIQAVIDAVAVNNDGHTMGLTTPNPVAQARVVRRALAASSVRAEQIGMIEAHGTGTLIGDPIELRALTDVFRETTDRRGFCAIGSVKSNLGHLFSAAGVAGLIKVLLSLEHGQIPPTLFCETPNPRFDFGNSPFFPNTYLRAWPSDQRLRIAGVSAFGLGGTNAHLIASQLNPVLRAEYPQRREPLAPPVFQRKRYWLEREPQSTEQATSSAAAQPGLVASLLALNFNQASDNSDNVEDQSIQSYV